MIKRLLKRILPLPAKNANEVNKQLLAEITSLRNDVMQQLSEEKHQRQQIDSELKNLKGLCNLQFLSIENTLSEILSQNTNSDLIRDSILPEIPSSVRTVMQNLSIDSFLTQFQKIVWHQSAAPYKDIDAFFRFVLKNSTDNYMYFLEKYTEYTFFLGDLLDTLEQTFFDNESFFSRWTQKTQLHYISFLLWKKKYEKADEILEKYMQLHGDSLLDFLCPVAYRAKTVFGIENPRIDFSASAYEQMQKNENWLERNLKGKKVALIGNGPQEKGSGNGSKIDSYDAVIRFNSYKINDEFAKDYGRKVTLWSNVNPVPDDLSEKGNFEAFMNMAIIYIEPLRFSLESSRIPKNFNNIFTFDRLSLQKKIWKETGIYFSSSGLMFVYLLKELNPDFSLADCYGFSFKEERIPEQWGHYFGNGVEQVAHSLEMEANAIKIKLAGS